LKIIITTQSPQLNTELDPRFGRSAYFLSIDPHTLDWQAIPNPGVAAPGGAGIQAAQFVAGQKVNAVVSGDFGPHASDALQAASIPMYLFGDCHSVRDVVVRYKAGQLERVGAATRGDCHTEGSAQT
jgi:predicted Fe-Mo cluster-binding NifX family protein